MGLSEILFHPRPTPWKILLKSYTANPFTKFIFMPLTPLAPENFDELDAILDDLRTRNDETPQWEFCEGFMAGLLCTRRPIAQAEYFEVLLGSDVHDSFEAVFTSPAQQQRFTQLWQQRWDEVATALDANVRSLEDERCYCPEVTDARAAFAALPAQEQSAFELKDLPAFAQVWALGLMYAVESWPEDWATSSREKEAAQTLDEALQAVVAMTEPDEGVPEISPVDENGPPSTSLVRLNIFADAVWAVYDLRALARKLGPRVATVRKAAMPGRNGLCFCGSQKKYKKCHGAPGQAEG